MNEHVATIASARPMATLGELVESVSSWNPSARASSQSFTYIDLSAIDQEAKRIVGTREIPCGDAPSRARQLVATGDILVATVRPNLNGVARVPERLDKATASTGFCVLRPRTSRIDAGYLFHWVKTPTFVAEMVMQAAGANYPAVSDKIIRESRIPLPSLVEQRRIAAILDKADALRAKRRAALAQLDTLTQSIFLEMFGDPATNPKELAVLPLNCLTQIMTGGTPSRAVDGYFGGDIPWLKTTEIAGQEIHATEEGLSPAGLRAIRGKLHPPKSIVIAMYGQGKTRGRCGLLTIHATVNQACAVIRPNPKFDSTFMFEQIRLCYERLRSLARGGNQENLNLELVGSFRSLLPPMAQQGVFDRRMRAVRGIGSAYRSSLVSLNNLFASLQLRAFRGEL